MKYLQESSGLKLIMAFAIFMMMISDLITYHQKVMGGMDLFGQHHPYTKPPKPGDNNNFQFSSWKSSDKSDTAKFSALLPSIVINLQRLQRFYIELQFRLGTGYLQPLLVHFSGKRAPPSFI